MPITCPLRLAPTIYSEETRLALPTLTDGYWHPHPAASFASQIVWRHPSGGLGRGLTTAPSARRPRSQTICAQMLARNTVLQAVLERHLVSMGRTRQTPLAVHAIYYPNAVGLIATDTAGNAETWQSGTPGRAVRLICERVETQAEAIARHDDYTAMIRDFGDAVLRHAPALAAELRFPAVEALLSREDRCVGGTAATAESYSNLPHLP